MHHRAFFGLLFFLLSTPCALIAWNGSTAAALTQEPQEKKAEDTEKKQDEEKKSEEKKSDDSRDRSWLNRIMQGSARYERDHSSVLGAFREVVTDSSKATVKVHCDGKLKAFGAIVFEDGYVLTKASELDGDIECELADGRKLKGEMIGFDRKNDLAMVKIEASSLPVVVWGLRSRIPGRQLDDHYRPGLESNSDRCRQPRPALDSRRRAGYQAATRRKQ